MPHGCGTPEPVPGTMRSGSAEMRDIVRAAGIRPE
jgi:hypothetical protein